MNFDPNFVCLNPTLIRNLEKSLKRLLDVGMKIEHAYNHTSKILDEIQPGKICLLKQVTYICPYIVLPKLTFSF